MSPELGLGLWDKSDLEQHHQQFNSVISRVLLPDGLE